MNPFRKQEHLRYRRLVTAQRSGTEHNMGKPTQPTRTKQTNTLKVNASIDKVYRLLWDKSNKMDGKTAIRRIKRILKGAGMSHDDYLKAILVKHRETKHST